MSNEQRGQVDRKGKGRAKDQNQNADREDEERQHQGAGDQRNEAGQQQMKEVRRPPPLPAVKGTIGAIGTQIIFRSRSQEFVEESRADSQNHLQDDHSFLDHLLPYVPTPLKLMTGPRKSFKSTKS
jgi:hypothetical protein